MSFTAQFLLLLHIEAVWGVSLPPFINDEGELLSTSPLPEWTLYVAQLINGQQIAIWRPNLDKATRAMCLVNAFSPHDHQQIEISREVALHQIAPPTITIEQAHLLAHPITREDYALLAAFQPGEEAYLLDARRGPLFGVIQDGHLLSLAHSSRRTTAACELGIDTHPLARRRGYALAATILWAEAVAREGLIPFYSAFAENTASLQLAHKAGYRVFARGTTVTIKSTSA